MSDATTGIPQAISSEELPVPVRIGAWVELVDGSLVGHLPVHPSLVHHGVVDPTALVTIIDMLGGLSADDDIDQWVFTSSLSLRAQPTAAPEALRCTVKVLRSGARSSTSEITLAAVDGAPVGMGLASFSRVQRRPTDPPKPVFDLAVMGDAWSKIEPLAISPRAASGMRTVDAATGHVEVDVDPKVQNPAGALHGAMIGMLVAAAAEEASAAAVGGVHVASDLDIRYLSQARTGPIATRARFVGDPALGSVAVDLVDRGRDDLLVAVANARSYRVG